MERLLPTHYFHIVVTLPHELNALVLYSKTLMHGALFHHRSCPQCRNHETSLWLDRQQAKLLPVDYFMATFTLPYEFSFPAWDHQKIVYDLLFSCASSTMKDFGLNPKNLGAGIGMTVVLHTHGRRARPTTG